MKNIQKIISILLVLFLTFSMIPVRISAEKNVEIGETATTETTEVTEATEVTAVTVVAEENAEIIEITGITYSFSEGPASDELYEAYLEQVFYGGISLFGTAAGQRLTGDEKVLYDALVPCFRQIADGQRASAVITVGHPVYGDSVDSEAYFTGSSFDGNMLGRVLDALLSDLPYACYWFDKTTGCSLTYSYSDTIIDMTLYFTVAQNYRGGDAYTVNTAKTAVAKLAAANANSIVSKYAAKSNYEKLLGYKNEICALVSYDDAAAGSGSFSVNNDPWQLISVFDGNASTNVVCEGYSKAFMYLCDLTTFSGDVTCYTVSGYMNGGGHMWNIVEIGNKYYLTDVTSSDSGTIGYYDSSLFMAGGSGSVTAGYQVGGVSFVYRQDMIELWGSGTNSILKLESANYDPNAGSGGGEHVHSYDTNHKCECGANGGSCGDNLVWEFQESSGILTISGTGAMYDYSYRTAPWYGYAASIENILMKGGTTIGSYAFFECNAVTNVSIPSSVTAIGQLAFRDCDTLREIEIPNSVQQLDRGVFYSCDNLSSVVMPEGITSIPESMFYYCKSLTQINIPNTVTSIGSSAFYYCEYLPQITIPSGISSIGGGAFYQCNALTEITLPSGITRIENRTFAGCDKLTSFTIPTGVTFIGEYAFSQCTGLQSITIPAAVTTLETAAFADCTQMTTVRFMGNAPSIGADAFHGMTLTAYHPNDATWTSDVKQNYGGTITWMSECSGSHTEVIVPAVPATCIATGLTEGKYCSVCNTILVAQEVVPMTAHTEVAIPAVPATCIANGLTEGMRCSVCNTTLTVQEVVPMTAHKLTVLPRVEPTCLVTGLTEGIVCENCDFVSQAQEIIPITDKHTYSADSICIYCSYIGGNCGKTITNLTWSLSNEGVLTISGTGEMADVDSSIYVPWNAFSSEITSVVVESGVTTIGKNMLGLLPNLEEVSLPDTLQHIGISSFHTNPALKSIDLPTNLQSLGDAAFQNSGLTEVTLPNNAGVGAYVFDNCTALKKVTMNTAQDLNGSYMFRGCTTLTDVALGNQISRISQYMFAGCTGLKQIVLPGSAQMIAANAFEGCTSLTDVILENGVEHIGPSAFAGCTALEEFTFPASITELEEAVFNRCENLTDIYFSGNAPTIDSSAFSTLKVTAHYPADNSTWTEDVRNYYGSTLISWVPDDHTHKYASTIIAPTCYEQGYTKYYCSCGHNYQDNFVETTGHRYNSNTDAYCTVCGEIRTVPMFRMYDPNSSEHFYTGSEEERDGLVALGWNYEGVGFNFPFIGSPVYRLYEPISGEHLYTTDETEKDTLLAAGWNYENVAFNSAENDAVPQYRLKNPNATRGAYHFTGSIEERDYLMSLGWIYQGIGWYSSWR